VRDRDLEYLLDFPDAGKIAEKNRRSWALLLKDELVVPLADGTLRPRARPTRAEMVRTLAGVVRHYQAEKLRRGSLRGAADGAILLDTSTGLRTLRLEPAVRLVKMQRGRGYPVSRLEALAGDKVAYHSRTGSGGVETVGYLEVAVNTKAASDDRFTSKFEWEDRMEREALDSRIGRHVRGIGRLTDLVPLEHGVSGRVTALRVVGTAGSQVIRGFPIRTALGIQENLFTIDRQRDASGAVSAFLFTGRGWGHGVGMCQVGAYGMALRGKDYREILHHYYTGVKLEKTYRSR